MGKRKKRIHVNQHVIKRNRLKDTDDPPITIKLGTENLYASSVTILGPSILRYSPHKPLLPCGARLVLETTADLEVDGRLVD